MCASLTAVSPLINCNIVGLVKQLQLQLFCITLTNVLKLKLSDAVTAVPVKPVIACGCKTPLT